MAKKPDSTYHGRPPKEINEKAFKAMCRQQCTKGEIAAFLDVDEETVHAWCLRTYNEPYSDIYKRYSEGGKKSLRRAMWCKAIKDKNTVMMIWLSKNYLGMADKIEKIDDEMVPYIIETSKGQLALGVKRKKAENLDDK